jgi:hypothetical protein
MCFIHRNKLSEIARIRYHVVKVNKLNIDKQYSIIILCKYIQ